MKNNPVMLLLLGGVMAEGAMAAAITNFHSVYDVANGRVQYTMDIDPTTAPTTSGVDSLLLDYDPAPPAPFIAGTTLLDATVNGASIFIPDDDEIVFLFDLLTSPTSLGFILGGVDAASIGSTATYDFDLELNTVGTTTPIQIFENIADQSASTAGRVPTSFNQLPVPTTLALMGLGLAVIGYQRRRKVFSS